MAAAGDLLGTLSGTGLSTTNPSAASGSVAVAVGDLVIAVMGQQTSLTVTAVTDNLGNTYTAQNVGTDAGNSAGRMFYSRVTVAGTLTTVNFAATANANNYALAVAAFAGPFTTSPLDTNPLNAPDVTTPYTGPATGTRAQARELIVSWCTAANGVTNWVGSNVTKDIQVADSGTVVSALIAHVRPANTTTLAPAFTGTAPSTDDTLGTASFKIDVIPITATFAGAGALSASIRRITSASAKFFGGGTFLDQQVVQYAPTWTGTDQDWNGYTARHVISAADLSGNATYGTAVQIAIDMAANTGVGDYLFQVVVGEQQDQTLNLLDGADSFRNWNAVGVTPTSSADPFGGTTAVKLTENSANSNHEYGLFPAKAATPIAYTASCYVKPGARTRCCLFLYDGSPNGVRSVFNLAGGQVADPANSFGTGWSSFSSGITTDAFATGSGGNGWYRCWIKATSNSAASYAFDVALDSGSGLAGQSTSYTGNGTSEIYLAAPQVVQGSTLTPYVVVNPYNFDGRERQATFAPWEKWTGTLGANVPIGWQPVGSSGIAHVLVDADVVDGLATYALQIRMDAVGGYQGIATNWPVFFTNADSSGFNSFVDGVTYTWTCYLRIPTGLLTASDCYWYGPGPGNLVLIASAATLNAQTKDLWVKYQVSHTWNSAVDYPQVAIINPNEATGTGFDVCRITVDPPVGGVTTYTQVAGAQTLTSNWVPFDFSNFKNLVVQTYFQQAVTDFPSRASATNTKSFYIIGNDFATIALPGYTAHAFQIGLSRVSTSSSGSLSASATVVSAGATVWQGSATLAGAGSLSAAAAQRMAAAGTFGGVGALSATTSQRMAAAATLGGVGSLSGSATVTSGATVQFGSATFAGVGSLSASTSQRMAAAARFAGVGSLSATATKSKTAAATLAGAGAASFNLNQRHAAQGRLQGVGAVSANVIKLGAATVWFGSATLGGHGLLSELTAFDPEAWWNFVSGAVDASGNGNDGTLHGTTLTTDPFNRPARTFNGTTDYIDGSTSPLEP